MRSKLLRMSKDQANPAWPLNMNDEKLATWVMNEGLLYRGENGDCVGLTELRRSKD